MKLLFKREQAKKGTGRIIFKLWSKFEPDEEEIALINQYDFRDAVLSGELQDGLLKQTIIFSVLIGIAVAAIVASVAGTSVGVALGFLAGGGFGYWWFNEKRDVIMVKDLLHGRHFNCDGVIDLAKQEAHIEYMAGVLRQVLESCKHWDGTEALAADPLPKDEAKQLILSL